MKKNISELEFKLRIISDCLKFKGFYWNNVFYDPTKNVFIIQIPKYRYMFKRKNPILKYLNENYVPAGIIILFDKI